MENPYIKQFPDLMSGKTIMYVHGFGSSAASGTVKRIRETLPSARVVAYDLPLHPEEAMALLQEKCAEERPALIIGTSMGGMYAEMLRGYDRILVNPAFEMGDTMHEHGMMGKQVFQNPRQDGVQETSPPDVLPASPMTSAVACGDSSVTKTRWYTPSSSSAATIRRLCISTESTA